MQALELKIPPPVVALLIATAMWLASRTASIELPFLVRAVTAIAIAILGGGIAFAAEMSFKRAKTSINPMRPQKTSSLVTAGIYRFTRNPMYLGLLLVLVAWAAFLASAWALAGPVAFVLYIGRFQIRPEERVLSAKFGTAYADYKSRVRRWL
jgi:protein-S-isoprenylcysteine O-methyltransferase Ste14